MTFLRRNSARVQARDAYVFDSDDSGNTLVSSENLAGADLADAILSDAEDLARNGHSVDLDRYIRLHPGLERDPIALDAAIEATLRSLQASGLGHQEAVFNLQRSFPDLSEEIADTATTNAVLFSTRRMVIDVAADPGPLPRDFGPLLPDGRSRYLLQESVGSGSFGVVYKAIDRHLSQDEGSPAVVAIKIFHTRGGDGVAEQDRFAGEAIKARRIADPNVVAVLDRGAADGVTYIVYEYVDGQTLESWCRTQNHRNWPVEPGNRNWQRLSASIVAQVARGVQAAHRRGILHCDLKPHNVLIDAATEKPKVTDFGIARHVGQRLARRRGSSEYAVGNLGFIAPEQYLEADGSDAFPADVYSLGGLLYWMLVGHTPNGRTRYEVDRRLRDPDGEARTARLLMELKACESDLRAICVKALSRDPLDRYASAAALADDLDAWLGHRPIIALHRGALGRARLWSRRSPLAASLLIVALIGVSGSLVFAGRSIIEKRIRTQFTSLVLGIKAGLTSAVQAGQTTDVLPQLWVLEWFYGNGVFGSKLDSRDVWSLRADLLRNLFAECEARGDGDTLSALIWGKALAFWCLQTGREEETIAVIDHAQPALLLQNPNDPFVREFSDLRAIAVILRHRRATHDGEALRTEQRGELGQAADALWTRYGSSGVEVPFSTTNEIRGLALEAVQIASEPTLLNDKDRGDAAEAEFVRTRRNGASGGTTPIVRRLKTG